MKKLKAILAVLIAVLMFVGCVPDDNNSDIQESDRQAINIEKTEEKLTEYFDILNIALGMQWDENGGRLIEKTDWLKAVLEEIYRHKAGETIPNENGSVKIDTYVNIAGWNFPFDKADVRIALENSYGYNKEADTVYMSDGLGNVNSAQIRNVKVVGDNTLMVTYRYGLQDIYNKEDDRWDFSSFDTKTMLVKIGADGYTFLSNYKQGDKSVDIYADGMEQVTDNTVTDVIQKMYNVAPILMGHSWDVSDGMIIFENTAQLGFNDALMRFHWLETGERIAGDVNGEYRIKVSDYVVQGAKYFPFSIQTLRRYYTADSSYDRQTDTVLAPDGYGNMCRAKVQRVYTDGEYYVAEYHYMWPDKVYDIGRTLLKKGDNGNFIFLANIRERTN